MIQVRGEYGVTHSVEPADDGTSDVVFTVLGKRLVLDPGEAAHLVLSVCDAVKLAAENAPTLPEVVLPVASDDFESDPFSPYRGHQI